MEGLFGYVLLVVLVLGFSFFLRGRRKKSIEKKALGQVQNNGDQILNVGNPEQGEAHPELGRLQFTV